MMYKSLLLFIAGVIFVINSNQAISAAETSTVAVYPATYNQDQANGVAWFKFEAEPGDLKQLEVTIWNKSAQRKAFKIYSADAVNSTEGVFSVSLKASKNGPSSWITLEQQQILLEPKQKRNLSLTVEIPEQAPPGDHTAALLVEEINQDKQKEGISISSRVGVRVYMTVNGEKISLIKFGQLAFDNIFKPKQILLPVHNMGNVNQNVSISGAVIGHTGVYKLSREIDYISFAGKKTKYQIPVDTWMPIGAYLTVSYQSSQDTSVNNQNFYTVGAGLGVVVLIGGAILYLSIRASRKKKRNAR